MNGHGHHHANGHVNGGRVHDRGRLRADGRDRGRRHVHVHRRVRDRGRLCAGDHGHVVVRMIVRVWVLMSMCMAMCPPTVVLLHVSGKQPRANTNNQNTREQTQPRNDILRGKPLCYQHDDSECYDAEGVCKSDDKPKENCVNYPAFRTDKVRSDDGFPVSWC